MSENRDASPMGSAAARTRLPFETDGIVNPLFQEQFIVLRAKVDREMERRGMKVLGVTSSVASEGKSLCSIMLAKALASKGGRNILLVDADLRKGDLAPRVDVPPTPGLSEFLQGKATLREALRATAVPGLFVIPSGSLKGSPSDLLAGERFSTFLEAARADFGVVILDCPPVLPVADTMTIRDRVDGIVFVYKAGSTPVPLLKRALDEIGTERVLGVVMNSVDVESERFRREYYGSYYTATGGG